MQIVFDEMKIDFIRRIKLKFEFMIGHANKMMRADLTRN